MKRSKGDVSPLAVSGMELFATSAMYGHPPHDLSPFQIKGVTLSPPRIFGGGRLKNFFVFSFPIEKSSSKVVGRGVNLPSLLPPCQDKEKQVEENLDKDVQVQLYVFNGLLDDLNAHVDVDFEGPSVSNVFPSGPTRGTF